MSFSVRPESVIRLPMKMNSGMAIMVKEFRPTKSCCAMTTIFRLPSPISPAAPMARARGTPKNIMTRNAINTVAIIPHPPLSFSAPYRL